MHEQKRKQPASAAGNRTDWQRGFKIERLRRIAGAFAAQLKPYSFGAFGIPNERDIAAALAEGRIAEECDSCAIFRRLKTTSTQTDFAGRRVQLPAGALSVSHIIGDAAAMIDALSARAVRMAVEIYEEDQATKSALLDLGFAYAFTKIMAGSEIKGVYFRGLKTPPPLADIETHALFNLGLFLSSAEHRNLKDELSAAAGRFAQHYSSYNKRGSWTAFALRGYDPNDPAFIIKPAEMSRAWKEKNGELLRRPCGETRIAAEFPAALAAAAKIPGVKERLRFMRLAPGGELSRHADITDRNAGLANGRIARLHIPIVSNPLVVFEGWDQRGQRHGLYFAERGLFYLDQRKPHRVRNSSDQERIHLVVDVFSSPALRALFNTRRATA